MRRGDNDARVGDLAGGAIPPTPSDPDHFTADADARRTKETQHSEEFQTVMGEIQIIRQMLGRTP